MTGMISVFQKDSPKQKCSECGLWIKVDGSESYQFASGKFFHPDCYYKIGKENQEETR